MSRSEGTNTLNCYYCGGVRHMVRGRCTGCASPYEDAHMKVERPQRFGVDCPQCSYDGWHLQMDDGTLMCPKCNALHEKPKVLALDTRTEFAQEKRARLERIRRRRRH